MMTRMSLLVVTFFFMTMMPVPLIAEEKTHIQYQYGHFHVEVGDRIYVCDKSSHNDPFQVLSETGGKCGCGTNLVEAEVTAVEKGAVKVMVHGKERTLSTVGKYICRSNEQSLCKAISQAPMKCPCDEDVDMRFVDSY